MLFVKARGYYMKAKNLKIAIDILLLLSFILSLFGWKDNLNKHIISGAAFAMAASIHFCLNRKWLPSIAKTFKAGKLSRKIKYQYYIDLLLLVVWSFTILSGFLTIGFAVMKIEGLFGFSRFHNISSKFGYFLIIIHVFQHRKQIGSYFKIKVVV